MLQYHRQSKGTGNLFEKLKLPIRFNSPSSQTTGAVRAIHTNILSAPSTRQDGLSGNICTSTPLISAPKSSITRRKTHMNCEKSDGFFMSEVE